MLTLGPGSVCDVCLEPFGKDLKAPCSIQCGHVFCVSCIQRLTRQQCPLCRSSFEIRYNVKLHLDLDGTQVTPSPVEKEARALQEAIANIANEGISEARLRQLIADGRTFLQGQPRNLFTDLRVSHRMIDYLCNVKTRLRAQDQAVDNLKAEMKQLTEEKRSLKKKIDKVTKSRDEAIQEQNRLQDHSAEAHAAYVAIVEQYNFVVGEWMRLNDEVRSLRMPPSPSLDEHDPDQDVAEIEATPNVHYASPELDQSKLEGVAAQDPNSFLISPLPQFTGRLPSIMDCFTSLPDLEEEKEDELHGRPQERVSLAREVLDCGAAGHPLSCDCEPLAMFPGSPSTARYAVQQQPSSSRRPSISSSGSPTYIPRTSPLENHIDPIPDTAVPTAPSGLSRTAPRGRDLTVETQRARSRSIPSRHASLSRPSSGPPTRPESPSLKSVATPSMQGRPAPSPRGAYASSSHHSMPALPTGRENEGLRTRLHDILQQDSGMSSSLPNMSASHFPPSMTREKAHSQDDRISRPPISASPATHRQPQQQPLDAAHRQTQQQSSDPHSRLLASHPVTSAVHTPMTTPSPNPHHSQQPVASSSASRAAAEIEERRKAERALEKERRKVEKERERSNSDNRERRSGDAERPRTDSISRTSTQRDPVNVYSSSKTSGISPSPLGPTPGAYASRPGPGVPSSHRDSNNVHASYQSRYPMGNGKTSTAMPVPNSASIYA